ncbi:hypothetical protein BAX94_06545 [Elizabethkingia meningoseptica]|uniref:HTH araC/xylS-type domain-containing protein n=1 Tax=Elizabethkingia meningoseptica TaxID=238 RepID=A0A1V3U0T9_ELIME|nr:MULTISPECIES: helix-turn-helix transcriptional regulator [Elizabethkingia]AQX13600.1 hypothetical protein BBD35_15015 [Elizabethkingia meningoseptica]MBG0515387.1 AraC family transcriptional regulator [Elizabethkingia meningoseptica]MDE5434246.1 helix-turn-helix domain-containing protein [Elizabethkingia meningoseptica]MDE5448250.1 helix-turn-helix domain-containing protein [Elizabethkingia meningoseptica]MDE5470597.1 helix-turn-helix domain-containing protein [Elizabethkingia meningoseptic
METIILKTIHSELENIIQYFIFFRSERNEMINYTTFPNTNLCLSIYKKNKIIIEQKNNTKYLSTIESDNTYVSLLSGFHESSLHVNVSAALDEICIIFHPAALRRFTKVSYHELINTTEAFQLLFPDCDSCFLEQLFEQTSIHIRQSMLENLLLKSIQDIYTSTRMEEALLFMNNNENIRIKDLSKNLSINESTLYRLFIDQIGQSPKAFLRTMRFRQVLDKLLGYKINKLTELAYNHHYTDQSHFIKDFKEITGETPGQLKKKTKVQQEELAWIYTES